MAKSADSTTNRLTDMVVKEVSLVDRAANKRQFLITKRDGSHMASKLVADGRGGFITTEVTKADETPAAPVVVAAVVAPVAATVAPTAEVEKAETLDKLSALAERVLTVAKAFRDKGEPVPEGFHDEVASMVLDIQKRRMGKARMDKLETGLATLTDLLAELKGETETVKATKAAVPAIAAVPAVAATVPVVAPAVADDVAKRLASQEAEIAKLRGAPVRSNSFPEEGAPAGGDVFAWPTDMAPGKRAAQNKAAGLSF